MNYALTVAAVYLAFVSAYIAWSLIVSAWHSYKLRQAERVAVDAAIERVLMLATLAAEHREAETVPPSAPDYREPGED